MLQRSAFKKLLRPFVKVSILTYRAGMRRLRAPRSRIVSVLNVTAQRISHRISVRAQTREDATYSTRTAQLMQGFREEPERDALDITRDLSISSARRHIALIVSGTVDANIKRDLNDAEKSAAYHFLKFWSGNIGSIDAILRLASVMDVNSMEASDKARWGAELNRAFNVTLKTREFLCAKALLEVVPSNMFVRLATALDERLPLQMGRSFSPDRGEESLAWMDHFPDSAHQKTRQTLISAVQTNSHEMLLDVPFDCLEQIAFNSRNMSDDPDSAYYAFLNMMTLISAEHEDLIFDEHDELEDGEGSKQESKKKVQERASKLQTRRSILQTRSERPQARNDRLRAFVERKKMRLDILQRDYTLALARARALCHMPGGIPEDLHVRIHLLNKLGRAPVVQRYVQRIHKIHRRGTVSSDEIALRLWAAWSPQSALDVLGGSESWATNEQTAMVALRSLIRLRRFEEAAQLVPRIVQWEALSNQVNIVKTAQASLEATSASIPLGEDSALHMMSHWLEQHREKPALAYQPEARRVLIYSHSLGIGGAERQVTNLISALCKDSEASSVHLLVKERPQTTYSINENSGRFTVHSFEDLPSDLPAPWCDHPLFQEVFELCRPLGLSGISQVMRSIYELRPEVIHVRGGLHAEVVLGAVLAGVPRVVVHFGSMTRGQQSSGTELEILRENLVERAIGLSAAYSQVVLAANSRAAANDWARAAQLPESRMEVLYNAVDAKELGYNAAATFNADATRSLVVGGVFRFAPVKDPLLWVEVARLVHDAIPGTRFLMVGDGPMRKSVERAIDVAGLTEQFELPGLITSNLFSYLQRMDLSLMSTRTESLPNAVIEAQLAGLPVIAPDVGGISEAIADETTARLVERTAPALAEAVIAGLQDTEWRADVHNCAPELILEKFSRKRQLSSTKNAYGW
jgi:glycosyltransferase involved in cell wall biosynthesis